MLSWNLLLYLTMMLPLPFTTDNGHVRSPSAHSYLLPAVQVNPHRSSEGWSLPHLPSACPNPSQLLHPGLTDYTGHLTILFSLMPISE